jgi:hypothetical protein
MVMDQRRVAVLMRDEEIPRQIAQELGRLACKESDSEVPLQRAFVLHEQRRHMLGCAWRNAHPRRAPHQRLHRAARILAQHGRL